MNREKFDNSEMEDVDFRDLLENANDIVQSVAPDGTFVYVNQAWVDTLGYSRDEAAQMKFFDILDNDCQEKCSTIFFNVMRGEKIDNIETVFIAKDGNRITVEGNCNCMFRDGKPYRTRGIFRNITARKAIEERLVQAQKLESLGVMAGGIAHEYNNILMGIMGFTDLMLRRDDLPTVVRRYAENIDKSARRAAKLTNQILSYAGQGSFQRESLDLNLIVRSLEKMLLASLAKNISLKLEERSIPPVVGDETSMRELVIQLVNNAAESIDANGGEIKVSTGVIEADREMLTTITFESDLPEGPYVFLKVEDSGHGIHEDNINNIFDPFYSTKFAGRGLGLATAHGIVKRHRGVIKVSSQPGRGSVFTVLLPVDSSVESVDEVVSSDVPEVVELRGEKKTVLVIDDELVVREVSKIMLESAGYDVFLAEDGERGVDIFRQEHENIDLVILDMVMPVMDGPETFRRLREISDRPPVLMSSGYSEDDVMSRFRKGGVAGFIHKPYNETKLKQKVADIFSGNG
jgi:PAS domain S-box-containing protein